MQVVNFRPRTDLQLGITVAVQAPLHLQAADLVHQRHGINRAMAGAATDSLSHVNAVVEVDELGQIVNTLPFDGTLFDPAVPHRFQQRGIGPDLAVTGHAGFGGRQPCKMRCLDRGVTIPTIDAQAANVMLMAERHRLILPLAYTGVPGRSVVPLGETANKRGKKHSAKDAGFGNGVRAWMKNLRHVLKAFLIGFGFTPDPGTSRFLF